MYLILAAFAVFVVLCLSELYWRKRKPKDEFSRKFVHISIGTFVACWPFFLSWNEIRLLSIAFIIVVSLSKWLHIFKAIHSVQRPTWGEVYFALVVGALTFVTHSKAIYAVSLLQMSLADGLAAVIGVKYGKRHRYYVYGHAKSIIGTLTFLVLSVGILSVYSLHSHHLALIYIAILALGATIAENVGIAGLDNLLVPFVIAVVLTHVA
jgi:phytol kinase